MIDESGFTDMVTRISFEINDLVEYKRMCKDNTKKVSHTMMINQKLINHFLARLNLGIGLGFSWYWDAKTENNEIKCFGSINAKGLTLKSFLIPDIEDIHLILKLVTEILINNKDIIADAIIENE